MTVLVTGASGFVGSIVCQVLIERGIAVRRALGPSARVLTHRDDCVIREPGEVANWSMAVKGIDSVVHLAARTSVMGDTAADPLAEYRRTNVAATQALAEAAQAAGVRRFIFLSSIKVNGEATTLRPYSETDAPCPEDAYGVSKREAEAA